MNRSARQAARDSVQQRTRPACPPAAVAVLVHVQQVNGPDVELEQLAAAVVQHVAQSGDLTFSVDRPGGRFESARFIVTAAERG